MLLYYESDYHIFILVLLYKIIIFSIDFPDLFTKSVENDNISHLLPKRVLTWNYPHEIFWKEKCEPVVVEMSQCLRDWDRDCHSLSLSNLITSYPAPLFAYSFKHKIVEYRAAQQE